MSYEARKKEVLEELAELPEMEDREREAARRGLESYFRDREGRLENLLELIEPGKEPRGRAWADRARDLAGWAMDTVQKIQAKGARSFLARVAFQEHKFFFHLHLSQVPVARDRMVRQTANLEKAMKEFDDKWKTIVSKDKALDEKMKKAAEQYDELLTEAAREAAKIEKQATEKMAALVGKAIKLGLKAVDFGAVETILKAGVKGAQIALDKTQDRRMEVFVLLSREEQVIHTFEVGREAVAEFLEDHSYAKIKAAREDGDEAAEKLEKKMATDGQKRDAAEFGKRAKDELARVFSQAEKQYREFAKRHEHLFFGPMGSQYVAELAETDLWKQHSERWKSAREDFDDLLRKRSLEAKESNVLGVDLRGLSRTDRMQVYFQMRNACQALLRAWNAWKDSNTARNPQEILDNREDMQSHLGALR
jgi:vacuolar-type H+-ATPase subunit H